MKIAVIQLARLGDIYQTWPVLSALKRANPSAEIHLITRAKFSAAAEGHPAVSRYWSLDTRDVLTPLIDERPDLELSLERLGAFVETLCGEGFEKVINLSFSPFSSSLAREIAGFVGEVRGYTRFSDQSLSIPDDGSAYFYAQVGPGRANRLHVTDLFAYVAGVEMIDADWAAPAAKPGSSEITQQIGEDAIVIHVGASDTRKTLSWSKWTQVVKGLLAAHPGNVVLVGSKEEATGAETIASVTGGRAPLNLVGKTSLAELIEIVRSARLLIGGDSAPVQIATLTGTPVLNLSLSLVSFWETGPRSAGSRILPIAEEQDISSEEIVSEARTMLAGQPGGKLAVLVPIARGPYVEQDRKTDAFGWELLRAIYMGEAFPAPSDEVFLMGLNRLQEINQLALEQLAALKRDPSNKIAANILDRVDDVTDQVIKMVPGAEPLVSWFRTERLRIGPMPVGDMIDANESVHRRLADVIGVYVNAYRGEDGHDDVALG